MRGSAGLAFRAGGWRDAPARLEHGVDGLEHGALIGGRELGDALQALQESRRLRRERVRGGYRTDFRFLAHEARAATGLSATQVKLHLHRLVELEYVLVHRAPGGHGVSYELVYRAADQTAEAAIFSGLREADALANASTDGEYDAERSDLAAERSGVGRPAAAGRPGESRTTHSTHIVRVDSELRVTDDTVGRRRLHKTGRASIVASYRSGSLMRDTTA